MTHRKSLQTYIYLLTALFIVTSCASPKPTSSANNTQSVPNEMTATPVIMPTPTAPLTPPALPLPFQSPNLNPLDTPHTYLQDTCQYLRNKWHPSYSKPGTVVMIIMFHGINRGAAETNMDISVGEFNILMNELKRQGFEAINTKQFLAFMERNITIPERSVLLIQDDRHLAENFNNHFRDYWDNWGWPVVNGWASLPDTPENLWLENIALENEGWVDHQAQGVMIGTYLSDDSSKAVIQRELEGSLTAFSDRFGKTPLAFIWPGGGFGQRPVEAARQLGYQLGFTLNSRGPVMFNWVPQADKFDPERPSYIPEGLINDPLMTLPRYWSSQALENIDRVRILGDEAMAYAEANKAVEFEYYRIMCEPAYGPIPT